MKMAFCYPCFGGKVPAAELFAAAREIGYAATEFHFRNAEIDALIDQALASGLKVASLCGHGSIASGLNDPAQHDRIAGELRKSIEFAAAKGVGNLICFSGNRREGQSDRQGADVCVAGLKRLAPLVEAAGINLNMELLNSRVDHAGYQADTSAWALNVVRQVGSPRVKLLYDIYHMQIMEGDVIRTLTTNVQWMGHVHTAGNPGRRDLDDEQELNYRGICRALAAAGYDGYVSHEFSPKADPIEALRTAYAICNVGPA